ncbi:MAG: hypothetical protein HY318_16395 [Armatimonadetes bacterium]|nr:hypothetical protein [Armatimonadota bacterium]
MPFSPVVMSKPIIEVHDLSKQYRLGVIGATTLRDSFDRWWQRLRRNGRRGERVSGRTGEGSTSLQHPDSAIRNPKSEITSPPHPLRMTGFGL